MGQWGIWQTAAGNLWMLGYAFQKGQNGGFAYYLTDVFCLHHLSALSRNWYLYDSLGWSLANKRFHISCKYIIRGYSYMYDVTKVLTA